MIEEQIYWPQVRCSIREVLEIATTKLKNAGVEQPIKDARSYLDIAQINHGNWFMEKKAR